MTSLSNGCLLSQAENYDHGALRLALWGAAPVPSCLAHRVEWTTNVEAQREESCRRLGREARRFRSLSHRIDRLPHPERGEK